LLRLKLWSNQQIIYICTQTIRKCTDTKCDGCRSQLKNDEVDSVAALLGDLVAYRAQGASHLEVLAGNLPSQKF
jgi:hypothetical protein